MVGLIENIKGKMTLDFKEEGDVIYLLGVVNNDIHCSEYLHRVCGIELSPAPYFNLDEEYKLHKKVAEFISRKLILSAHDISEGGLFVTLCECGFIRELGFSVTIPLSFREGLGLPAGQAGVRPDSFLFGEGQGRVVVSVAIDKVNLFEKTIGDFPCTKLGVVTSGEMVIDGDFWGTIDWWKDKYDTAIENYLSKEEADSALSSI
jgi:phosphoribosylformylglycinamidine synthase